MSNYETMIQEVDGRISAIDLNGKHIIKDCKTIIVFLKEKLSEMKALVESTTFSDETEVIIFFKHQKPMLLGRLIYFHKILNVESQRPLDETILDAYYEKRQEEQKLFFDRHVSFFQYYRLGSCHMDTYYFLRGNQENVFDVDVCPLEDDSVFTTGYDQHRNGNALCFPVRAACLPAKHGWSDAEIKECLPMDWQHHRIGGAGVRIERDGLHQQRRNAHQRTGCLCGHITGYGYSRLLQCLYGHETT